jgi:hypothetical protein
MVKPQKIKKKVMHFKVWWIKGKYFHSKRQEKEIVRRNPTKERLKARMANNEHYDIRSSIQTLCVVIELQRCQAVLSLWPGQVQLRWLLFGSLCSLLMAFPVYISPFFPESP